MKITAIPAPRYGLDNYIWIVELGGEVICVDPTQSDVVLDYLKKDQLSISQFWITHGHQDHIGGLPDLLLQFPQAKIVGSPLISLVNKPVQDNAIVQAGEQVVAIYETLGHKRDHVIFILKSTPSWRVFCGDILFSAGCGRVLDGTMQELFASIMRINTLPEDTLLYPAHEYTRRNLEFASYLEPNNTIVKQTLMQTKSNTYNTLPVTLQHERQVNPFLRVNESTIISRVLSLMPCATTTPLGIFTGLRTLRNQF